MVDFFYLNEEITASSKQIGEKKSISILYECKQNISDWIFHEFPKQNICI